MAVAPSYNMRGYLRNCKSQGVTMKDEFYTDFIKDDKTKQFYNGVSFANEYNKYLSKIVKPYIMTDEEYRKYKCNPWYMSQDLYGTTEYWYMLLHLNEMYSANEFTRKSIKVYSDELQSKLDDIKTVLDDYIRLNKADISKTKREIIEGIDGMWD